MKRIENKADLLKWANGINSQLDRRPKCDQQDVYARSQRETLDAAFVEAAPDERRVILCSVYNVMSYDEVEHLLIKLSQARVNKEMARAYDELDQADTIRNNATYAREQAQDAREKVFKDCMKPYHRKLTDLRRECARLQTSNDERRRAEVELVESARHWKREANEYQAKAERFDALRDLLK